MRESLANKQRFRLTIDHCGDIWVQSCDLGILLSHCYMTKKLIEMVIEAEMERIEEQIVLILSSFTLWVWVSCFLCCAAADATLPSLHLLIKYTVMLMFFQADVND